MRKTMRTFFACCLAASTALVSTACVGDDIAPKGDSGSLRINVNTTQFFGEAANGSNKTAKSRAANENDYKDINNYTIDITDAYGNSANGFPKAFADIASPIALKNGSYTLKAYMGKEHAASTEEFLSTGSMPFNISGNEVENVSVVCAPTCAKVKANFSEDMDEYFADYAVEFKTAALAAEDGSATWTKTQSAPYYVKVAKEGEQVSAIIKAVRKGDNSTVNVTRTYTLLPNKAWVINVSPTGKNGQLTITVSIDSTVIEENIDITVPSDWI